jgi:hypothetical protein
MNALPWGDVFSAFENAFRLYSWSKICGAAFPREWVFPWDDLFNVWGMRFILYQGMWKIEPPGPASVFCRPHKSYTQMAKVNQTNRSTMNVFLFPG